MRRVILMLFVVAAGLSIDAAAWAQPPGGRGDMLRRFDGNGDGKLEQSEIPDRAKPFVQRMAERAGIDPNGTISIEALSSGEGRSSGGSSSDRRRSGRSDRGRDRGDRGDRGRGDWRSRWREEQESSGPAGDPTTVAGFGVPPMYDPVPGFDVPLSATGSLTNAQLNEIYPSRIMGYVDSRILNENDKNKNGMLDASEWSQVRWRSDPRESDLNGDGILTRAELAARIAKRYEVEVELPEVAPRRGLRRTIPGRTPAKTTSASQPGSRSEDSNSPSQRRIQSEGRRESRGSGRQVCQIVD